MSEKNNKKSNQTEVEEVVVESTNTEEELDDFNFTTIVDSSETIVTEICITKGFDPVTQQPKPVIFRKKYTEDQIELLRGLSTAWDNKIKEATTNEQKNIFENKKLTTEIEITKLENLLQSKYIVWKATWKKPGFKEVIDIENNSFMEDSLGDKTEFSEFDNSRFKIRNLLMSWDVKNNGEPVPVSDALKVDPDILRAFLAELNNRLYNYRIEVKK